MRPPPAHPDLMPLQVGTSQAIVRAYNALMQLAPTLGARLGRIAAVAHQTGASEALHGLNAIPPQTVAQHQPYWTLRAHLLTELKQPAAAHQARARAIGLTEDPAIRRFLQKQNFKNPP